MDEIERYLWMSMGAIVGFFLSGLINLGMGALVKSIYSHRGPRN